MKKGIMILAIITVAMAGVAFADVTTTAQAAQDVPGVTSTIGADGTKTVNLSEVDAGKLPEQYEAKVVLEAPIVMGEQKYIRKNKKDYSTYEKYEELYDGKIATFGKYGTKEVVGENITPNGVFLDMPEGGIEGNYDTSIDEEGNIYILDIYNGRIQEFDKNGKHSRNIPIKNVYKKSIKKVNEQIAGNEYREKEEWVVEDLKNEIAATNGKIYVRNGMKNNIEQIDENGNVKGTINIPDKIGGKNTKKMRMTIDGGDMSFANMYIDNNNTVKTSMLNNEPWRAGRNRRNAVKEKKWKTVNGCNIKFESPEDGISVIEDRYQDSEKHQYIYIEDVKGPKSGFYKVSTNCVLIAEINDWVYWYGNDWKDECKIDPQPLNSNIENSEFFTKDGGLYLFQYVCSKDKKYEGQIRVIKLKSKK